MKKVYIDTNILISFVVGKEKDNKFDLAKQVFDKIEAGTYLGAISTLTLMEALGVFRRIIATNRALMQTISRNGQGEYVKNDSYATFQTMVGQLVKMRNVKFERGTPTPIGKVFDTSFDIMKEINGIVKFYDKCGFCDSFVKTSVHKAVASMDIIHAVIAKDTGCDSLVTMDKGFKELSGNDLLDSLEIEVLER